jgi:endoglucanase
MPILMRAARFILVMLLPFVPIALLGQQQTRPPLHTSGHSILDATGHVVRLTSVNWYGFDQKEFVVGGLDHAPLTTIIAQIREIGVNSVRLPWANETLESNPVVPDYAVKANPQFRGKHAMEIMDAVITALARAHIMVILDNHVSRADWCCKDDDGNGLWYNAEYPEGKWLADWGTIVRRYKNQPWVVGADLRNELRSGAQWGGNDPRLDWHAAAERGGNAVLAANPKLLLMVEGPEYSTDFTAFAKLPITLNTPNRVVYSPHAYAIAGHTFQNYDELKQAYNARAGYLLHTEPGVPLWVGEFGECQTLQCGDRAQWFRWFVQYLRENDLGWSYWALNGTQSSGIGRKYDEVETFGLLTPNYLHIAAPEMVRLLQTIESPPQTIPRELWGKWVVRRELPTTTISCRGEKEAKTLIGTEVEYAPGFFRWHKWVTKNPAAKITTITAEQFHDENSGMGTNSSQVTFQQLGIKADKATQVVIQHPAANITGATTETPGDNVLIKNENTIIFSVCSVYFEAERSATLPRN